MVTVDVDIGNILLGIGAILTGIAAIKGSSKPKKKQQRKK